MVSRESSCGNISGSITPGRRTWYEQSSVLYDAMFTLEMWQKANSSVVDPHTPSLSMCVCAVHILLMYCTQECNFPAVSYNLAHSTNTVLCDDAPHGADSHIQ